MTLSAMFAANRAFVAGSWLCVLLAASLFIFKISTHADSLFLDDVAHDLFHFGGAWWDWRFPPAPAYVPDVLLYFVGYAILPTAPLRIFFVTVCHAIILSGVAWWLGRRIRPELSASAQALSVLLVALATLVAARSNMWLYFNSTNNHLPALFFSLISLGLFLEFLERPGILNATLIVVSGALAKASTGVFLISFVGPAVVALSLVLLVALFRNPLAQFRLRIAASLVLVGASQLLAKLVEGLVTFHSALANVGRMGSSPEAIAIAAKWFAITTADAFDRANLFTFGFSCLVLAAFIFLAYRLFSRAELRTTSDPDGRERLSAVLPLARLGAHDWRLAASGLLLFTMVPINLLGAIVSGGFRDYLGYRYLMTPIALALLLAVVHLDRNFSNSRRIKLFLVLAIPATALGCIASLSVVRKQNENTTIRDVVLYGRGVDETRVEGCLVELERRGVQLKAGVSDFWVVRAVFWKSGYTRSLLTVSAGFDPHFWMSTLGPMIHPERYPPRYYNFAILAERGGFDVNTIGKLLPAGYTTYPCDGTRYRIWYYPGDQLNVAVKAIEERFVVDNLLKPAEASR